ncbi:MAG: four helix bundle protein [Chitinophagaceae bacterium]|nr:four helix bundle protein [Chitinophagaceae bacterium]
MSTVKKFEELEVWQKARVLENKIFPLTQGGKLSKDFKLREQLNGATGSAMDNIAEGFGRGSRLEFVQFLTVARGSASEVQSQLYRCLDREYFSAALFQELYILADEICKMTTGFIEYLNKSDYKGQKFKDRKK